MTTLIAGAGLAGLTVAARLRAEGHPFELWDPSPPGGRARSQQKAGAWLNLGPHALPRRGHAMRHFAALGVSWSGAEPRKGLFMTRGRNRFPVPLNPLALLTTSAFPFASRWSAGRALARLNGRVGQSVDAWLAAIPDADARQWVRALVRLGTYGGDTARMDARAVCQQLRTVLRGVVYIDGGWQSLVDELHARAGTVLPRSLRALRAEGSQWCASDGTDEYRFDTVVLAMPPDRVRALLGERVVPPTETVHMATLDLVLESLPEPDVRFAMALDAPLYFSVHSGVARLAESDRVVIHAARYLDGTEQTDSRAAIEAYLDRVQPQWREHVCHRRYLPKIAVHHGFPSIDGPRPNVEVGNGLFVAGDWVGQEGMLADAAVASGARAAAQVLSIREHRATHALAG